MLTASIATQNMTTALFSYGEAACGRSEVVLGGDRQRTIGNCGGGWFDQAAYRSGAQQPVDVVGSERENEAIDDAIDEERDQGRRRGQKRRHRVGGPQNAVHHPGLAPDLGGEPAG